MVLALFDYEAQTCHGCGGFLPETTDESAESAYEADPPWRCHRCTALNKHKAEWRKDLKDDETGKFEALVLWPAHLRKGGATHG